MRIALIAHDSKKLTMIKFVQEHKEVFLGHELCATGTTGKLIEEHVGLQIHRFQSGPLGGDQQIGAKVAVGEIDMVFFLRDPLQSQAHEPDISALLRLCDVRDIPLATNLGTARALVAHLKAVSTS